MALMTGNYAAPVSQPRRHRRLQLVAVSRIGGVVERLGQSLLGGSVSRNPDHPERSVAHPEAPCQVSAEYEQHADGAHASEVIRRDYPPPHSRRTHRLRRRLRASSPAQPSPSLATLRRVGQPSNVRAVQSQAQGSRKKNLKTEKTYFNFYYRAFWGHVRKSMKIDGIL